MSLNKFRELPIGALFYYNGLIYSKTSENSAYNVRYGEFTVHPDEEVETTEPTVWRQGAKGNMVVFEIAFILAPLFALWVWFVVDWSC